MISKSAIWLLIPWSLYISLFHDNQRNVSIHVTSGTYNSKSLCNVPFEIKNKGGAVAVDFKTDYLGKALFDERYYRDGYKIYFYNYEKKQLIGSFELPLNGIRKTVSINLKPQNCGPNEYVGDDKVKILLAQLQKLNSKIRILKDTLKNERIENGLRKIKIDEIKKERDYFKVEYEKVKETSNENIETLMIELQKVDQRVKALENELENRDQKLNRNIEETRKTVISGLRNATLKITYMDVNGNTGNVKAVEIASFKYELKSNVYVPDYFQLYLKIMLAHGDMSTQEYLPGRQGEKFILLSLNQTRERSTGRVYLEPIINLESFPGVTEGRVRPIIFPELYLVLNTNSNNITDADRIQYNSNDNSCTYQIGRDGVLRPKRK